MKRKPYKTVTLYNVISHRIFIDDDKAEHWDTIDKNDTYFKWSDSIDKKLKEFNDLKFTDKDIEDSDGIEKILWCAEIPVKLWNKFKKHEDVHEYISNEVNYDFKTLKSKFWEWQDLLSKEELKELYQD